MKTNKFARKPFYVDAVRVSEANIEEVAEWCGGIIKEGPAGKFIQVKVHRPLTERQTQAYLGDWVLYAGTGFKVYVPKAFDKSFEKVKTLTKAQADEAGITVPHEKSKKPVNPRPPKKHPTLRGAVTNVGAAIREAEALKSAEMKVEEVQPLEDKAQAEVLIEMAGPESGIIAGHVMSCHTRRNDDNWSCSCPKSAGDIEADRLIAEADRIRGI